MRANCQLRALEGVLLNILLNVFFRSNLNLSVQKGALCSSQWVTLQHLALLLLPPTFLHELNKNSLSIILSNSILALQNGALCWSQQVTRQHLAYLLLSPAFHNQFDKIFLSIILGNPLLFLLLQNETLPSCQKMTYQHSTGLD